jgi:hypothetical protein
MFVLESMSSWSRTRIQPQRQYKQAVTESIDTSLHEVLPPKRDLIHIQYKKPVCIDTAVILVFFNPAKSFRIIQNILYIKQLLDNASIPYFIGEIAYNDEPHLFGSSNPNIFLYRSSSYMFSKENIIQCILKNEGLARFTKYVIMDSDILFDTSDWIDAISSSLDTYDIIQPYQYACRLNLEYKSDSIIPSIAFDPKNGHPGYVWAFRRDWWLRSGGLYEYALIGGGDAVFAYSLGLPTKAIPSVYLKDRLPLRVETSLSYLPFTIWHLAHGSILSRQYRERSDKLQNALKIINISSVHDAVIRTYEGILEWKPAYKNTLNAILLHYFTTRKDDSM